MTLSRLRHPAILVAAVALLLGACGKKETHQQLELQRYLRQIPQMESFRINDPLEEWDTSVTGYKQQVRDYEHRITKLELMKPMQGDLRPLHESYIEANKHKLQAWRQFLGEMGGGDLVQRMDAYRFAIDDANKTIAIFYTELRAMCEKREVTVPEDFPNE